MLLLAACNKSERRYVIGVSQCSEDIWRDKLNDELVMGTYQHDNVSLRFASANDDDRLQTEQINKFIEDGVDLLIVSPNQIHTITSAIDKAYNRGIPVILFDRKTDSGKYTAFIGADNFEAGKTMGEYIARQLGGRGNVAEIAGLTGSSPAIERHKGFMQAIGRYPGIRLIAQHHAGWLKERSQIEMDSILNEHHHIDYVFGQNDRMAIGARQTAEKRGFKDIKFVGIDALPVPGGGLENVRDGRLEASYIYPTRGDLVLQLAINILEHKPYERDNYLKGALVTRDNAHVLLLQSEEMNKQRSRLYSLHDRVDTYLAQYNHQKVYLLLFSIITLLLVGLIVYIYRTINMRRRLEEEATNAKLQFFTNISHELRTPLTLIADPVEHIIDDDNLTRQQRNMLLIVRRNVNVLTRLVSEILDFRKIQNGKMTLTLSDFDLAVYMRQWLDVFATTAGKKKISLELHAASPLSIRADIYKVERICYNLLSNAMKYTPEGGRITFSAVTEGNSVHISVADTGIGMTRDEAAHVFERFYQVRHPHKGGTGIGLAIVKSFAELHKGTVAVESEPGRGSTFTVTLPLKAKGTNIVETTEVYTPAEYPPEDSAAEDITSQAMTDKITRPGEKEKPSLLVIDDNPDIRSYVMTLLGNDYNVEQAADGREGLHKAMRDVPDLIICDVMMPVMDGAEFCRRVRADRNTSHIPLVMLTAKTDDDSKAEGMECGADAYIEKPFSMKYLEACIRNMLDMRRLLMQKFSNTPSEPIAKIAQTAVDDDFLTRMNGLIEDNIDNPELSVGFIAERMNISRSGLFAKLKLLADVTPNEMIQVVRLRHAARLLREGKYRVNEVCYMVGFSSPSYFSKCFSKQFGVKPAEYK